jgi:hypothetical protein
MKPLTIPRPRRPVNARVIAVEPPRASASRYAVLVPASGQSRNAVPACTATAPAARAASARLAALGNERVCARLGCAASVLDARDGRPHGDSGPARRVDEVGRRRPERRRDDVDARLDRDRELLGEVVVVEARLAHLVAFDLERARIGSDCFAVDRLWLQHEEVDGERPVGQLAGSREPGGQLARFQVARRDEAEAACVRDRGCELRRRRPTGERCEDDRRDHSSASVPRTTPNSACRHVACANARAPKTR